MEETRVIKRVGYCSTGQATQEDCIKCHNATMGTILIDRLCLDCFEKKIIEKQIIISILNLAIPSLSPESMENLEEALEELISNRHIPISLEAFFRNSEGN